MNERVFSSASGLRALAWRGAIACALVSAAAIGAVLSVRAILPAEGGVAAGLRVGGAPVDARVAPRSLAEAAAARVLAQKVELHSGDRLVLSATGEALGAKVDVAALERAIAGVGREGDFFTRLDDALLARRGGVDVPVRVELPAERLAERLERDKELYDAKPRAAKLVLATHTATPHVPGRYLDVYGTADALASALEAGEPSVSAPVFEEEPRASSEVVARLDTRAVVSSYETRFGFVGGQAGRAQNVERAAAQMDGVVLMPGEIVSFNDDVGPRTEDNGFAPAPEIYKGEMREGIGGGTCQVAGTLHAAAFFAGLDVVQRSNHSRPSGYIGLGLDATVVYPDVDLKLRNPYDFPIVVHATVHEGRLRFELLGREKPASVDLATDTVGVAAFKRKVEEVSWLPAGEVKLKQKGIRGLSIRKTRRIHLRDGTERVEVTTDVYPPTFEIYLVPPGTDVDAALPAPAAQQT